MYRLNMTTGARFAPGDTVTYKNTKYIVKDLIVKVLNIETSDVSIRMTVSDEYGDKVLVNFWNTDYGKDPNIYKASDGSYKLAEIEEGNTISILGFEYMYGNTKQINACGGYQLSEVQMSVKTGVNKTLILEAINNMFDLIQDTSLKETCKYALQKYNDKFTIKPAAAKHHHNYLGGLLQHTYEVMMIAYNSSLPFKVNRDVIITAAFFHDMMKIHEYTDDGEWTEYGDLLGHVVGSTFAFKDIADEHNVNKTLVAKVMHCILSHHGRNEWGSPVTPHSLEAVIVHCADLMSSQLNPIGVNSNTILKDGYIDY